MKLGISWNVTSADQAWRNHSATRGDRFPSNLVPWHRKDPKGTAPAWWTNGTGRCSSHCSMMVIRLHLLNFDRFLTSDDRWLIWPWSDTESHSQCAGFDILHCRLMTCRAIAVGCGVICSEEKNPTQGTQGWGWLKHFWIIWKSFMVTPILWLFSRSIIDEYWPHDWLVGGFKHSLFSISCMG